MRARAAADMSQTAECLRAAVLAEAGKAHAPSTHNSWGDKAAPYKFDQAESQSVFSS